MKNKDKINIINLILGSFKLKSLTIHLFGLELIFNVFPGAIFKDSFHLKCLDTLFFPGHSLESNVLSQMSPHSCFLPFTRGPPLPHVGDEARICNRNRTCHPSVLKYLLTKNHNLITGAGLLTSMFTGEAVNMAEI